MRAIPAADAPKADWRAWALAVRKGVERAGSTEGELGGDQPDAPSHDHRIVEHPVVEHLRAWGAYRNARHVLLYLPLADEIDLSTLAAEPGRDVYVTRTWPDRARPLTIHAYDIAALEQHPYGFLQPGPTSAVVDPEIIDLALVPGLAFDAGGARLGFGRGYYDRLLAQLSAAAIKVGVTTSHTVVPRLPIEPHDVAMDFLVTEAGVGAVVPASSRQPVGRALHEPDR